MQQQDIPSVVAQAATDRQLGTLIRATPAFTSKGQGNGCGPGILVGIGVVPLLVAFPLLSSPKWSGFSVLLFLVAGGLFLMAFASKRDSSPEHHWRYFLYHAGFIRWKPGRAEAYTWSDIATVKDGILEFTRSGRAKSRFYRATLHLQNGNSVKFEEGLPSHDTLNSPPTLIQEIVYYAKQATK